MVRNNEGIEYMMATGSSITDLHKECISFELKDNYFIDYHIFPLNLHFPVVNESLQKH